MQVFKLTQVSSNQVGNVKMGEKQKLESPVVQGNEGDVPETTEAIEAKKLAEQDDGSEKKLEDAGLLEKSEEDGEQYLKIDGPVGRVFTNALNVILAQESYLSFAEVESSMYPDGVDQVKKKDRTIYVYCVDSENVQLEDVIHLGDEIAKSKDNSYVIAMESSSKKFSKASGHLLELAKRPNVTLCYSAERVAEYIGDLMKP